MELSKCFEGPQLEEFARFMADNSVQPSTQVAYRTGVKVWREYIGQVAAERRPDELLRDVRDMRVKALHILALALYLYRGKGWRGQQITSHFAAIGLFLTANIENEGIMEHSIVVRARAAVSMTQAERAVEMQRRIDTAIMPMTYPMLDHARGVFWDGTDWGKDQGRSCKAAYLATCMMMDTGNRVSNATGPKTDRILGVVTDHGIRVKDLEVTLQHPDGQRTFVLKGGPVLHEYLFRNRCPTTGAFKGVLNMRLTFLTQKVVRKGGAPDPLYYGNRSPREARYIQDMMLWLYFNAKLGALDYLYTRYQLAPKAGAKTDKRLLQSRDITAVVKASAEAFGLDPKRFATSSARRFLAAGGGLEDPEMKQRAGWTPNSTTPTTHYLREFEGRGAFAAPSDQAPVHLPYLRGAGR
jgi:hypothetical protein